MSKRELQYWLAAEAELIVRGRSTFYAMLRQCERDVDAAIMAVRARAERGKV